MKGRRKRRPFFGQAFGQRALRIEFELEFPGGIAPRTPRSLRHKEITLRNCRVSSSSPRPEQSTPALLEMTVGFQTPESRKASISNSGMPHNPSPNRQRLTVREESLQCLGSAVEQLSLGHGHIGPHLSSAGSMQEVNVRPSRASSSMRTCIPNEKSPATPPATPCKLKTHPRQSLGLTSP